MAKLSEDIDPRVTYLVMLNGKEEAQLHDALADVIQRKFFSEPEALAAAQRALRFLASGGWLEVSLQQAGHARALSGAELESIISSPSSWAPPDCAGVPLIVLAPTDLGVTAWNSGFPILELSEQARASLMFPQLDSGVSSV